MRKRFLLLFVFPAYLFAQNSIPTFTVSGKIIDSNTKNPLDYATVIFKSIDSNKAIYGGITNQRGNFSIEVEKGFYNTTVEFISYQTKNLSISKVDSDINIGTIELEFAAELLGEIEINGKINTLDFKQNKQVYNVTKDLASNGVSATQILTNIPSVSVGSEGNLTIRGQGNVTVLIDGKLSSLSKTDALNSLPAGSIEKIEVIANPGASQRSSASGIINIILKKGKNEGLNGSVTASGGYKENYGGLLTLNHKSKTVNFFTTASYAHSIKNTLVKVENEYFTNGITTGFLAENTLIESPSNDFMAIVGAEFYLSDNSTLTATAKFDDIKRAPFFETNTTFFDATKNITSINIGNNDSKFNDQIMEFSIDFNQNFKNEGQNISAYITYSNDNEQYINDFTNSNPVFVNENYTEENTLENAEMSVKYTHPINESAGFEIGYLGTFGKTPYTLAKETTQEEIIYSDYIHGFYAEFEKYWNSFYFGVGLRAELTEINSEFTNLNTIQTNNFNNFFPSIYLENTFNENNSLSLSYSRTTQRPGYNELRPFEQKISETLSYIGNINLNPMFINATNLSYSYYGEKLTFITSLYWSNYEDLVQPISFETTEANNGIPKIITTVENIGSLNQYGLSVTADLQAAKWLNFMGNANFYQMEQTGIFQHTNANNEIVIKDFENSNFSADFSLLTKIKIPKLIDFQFNVINSLDSKAVYSMLKANTYVNATINKDLCNKKASLSLSVDDVFNSRNVNRTWFEQNYTSNRIASQKYRTMILSFTYRFNQDKQQRSVDFDKKSNKVKI